MKKIAIIFAIVGLVAGVAYASFEDLKELNVEKKASMSEARAEVDAELQEQSKEETPWLAIVWIKSIPEVVWAAIIASGITLLGVTLANRANRKCLLMQLNHAAQEKDKERQMSLRCDVYLFAAEKIGQQLSYLANFYQTKDASPIGYDEAITKIDIIGSKETIAALNQFNDHMAEAYYELITKKNEIVLLEARHDYLMEGLKNGTLEPQKSIEEFKKIYHKKTKLTCELAGKCQQKTQLVENFLTSVIVAIRKEMNTPFDKAAYLAMMKISQNKWEENLNKFIASMKDQCTQELRLIDQIVQETEI